MSTRPLILDGRSSRDEPFTAPFNSPRISPKVGDVYHVTADISVGRGKRVRRGVMGHVTQLTANGGLTIELPFTVSKDNEFASGVEAFDLAERMWQRSGQIVVSGLDPRIVPTPAEVGPPAGPYMSKIPERRERTTEIAGRVDIGQTRIRRTLGR